MATEILKDRVGNRIGRLETKGDGKVNAFDRVGNRVGKYDPKDNVTRDHVGNKVGTGNLLAGLLVK